MTALLNGPELERFMKIPTMLDAETEAGLFLEISSLARRRVEKLVGKEAARDIAQDVVLECLVRLRAGNSPFDLAKLPGLVRRMARRRAFDQLRRADRRAQPDEDYMRELSESRHAWMDPDAAVDEGEVAAIRDRALASLSDECRRAYMMVREDGQSYDEAAARLGTSRASVNHYVVKAQRHLRKALSKQGLMAAPPVRAGRESRSRSPSTAAPRDTLPRPSIMTSMLVARSPPARTHIQRRRTRCRQCRATCCSRYATWQDSSSSTPTSWMA